MFHFSRPKNNYVLFISSYQVKNRYRFLWFLLLFLLQFHSQLSLISVKSQLSSLAIAMDVRDWTSEAIPIHVVDFQVYDAWTGD